MEPTLFDRPTTFERILNFIDARGRITQLDSMAVFCTAITQRCNEMIKYPKRYEKYLRGRRLTKRGSNNGQTHFEEYFFEKQETGGI